MRGLADGCACSACRAGNSRAYLHHLITCGEMLGQTLLHAHNVHQYALLFDDVRAAIDGGYFDDYREWFRACGARAPFPTTAATTAPAAECA